VSRAFPVVPYNQHDQTQGKAVAMATVGRSWRGHHHLPISCMSTERASQRQPQKERGASKQRTRVHRARIT